MALEAPPLRCRHCGAPASLDATACGYCGQPIEPLELLKSGSDSLRRAAAECEMTLRKDPRDPVALVCLGAHLLRQGLYDDAVRYLKRAVDAAPTSAEGHYFLALAEAQRFGWTSAFVEECIAKAERLSPESKSVQSLRAVLRGIKALDQGSRPALQRAIDEFHRAAALDPRNPYAYFFVAEAFDRGGCPKEAIEAYRKTAERLHDDPKVFIKLGLLYKKTGEPRLALEQFLRALALDPNNAAVKELAAALKKRSGG